MEQIEITNFKGILKKRNHLQFDQKAINKVH